MGVFKLLIGLAYRATLLFYQCWVIILWHSYGPGNVWRYIEFWADKLGV